MSNISGDEGSFSSGEVQQNKEITKHQSLANNSNAISDGSSSKQQQPAKKKRNLPGTPDPTAEVVALSPTTLMATNRFVCEICNKGFQRDQNLQLHRRGHNLPWKLRQRTPSEVKKRVYICPEPTCVHHNPSRALGDLTGIKKHYSRKHGEKKWKCDKCSKKYAVQSDWKAHQKTCGTREYKCDCGTIFSRRDSFITHRAFCDALAEENNKVNQTLMGQEGPNLQAQMPNDFVSTMPNASNTSIGLSDFNNPLKSLPQEFIPIPYNSMASHHNMFSTASGTLLGQRNIPSSSGLQLGSNIPNPSGFNYHQDNKNMGQLSGLAQMSATALLQKAAQMGATTANTSINSPMMQKSFVSSMAGPNQVSGQPNSKPIMNLQSYDSFQAQEDQQQQQQQQHSHFSSGGFMQKSQDLAQFFNGNNSTTVNDDVMMYGGMLMGGGGGGGDRQISSVGFLNNRAVDMHAHQDFDNQMSSGNNNRSADDNIDHIRFGGNNKNDHMTTVDFLGVGASRPHINVHDQRLELENVSQQGMQVMHNSSNNNNNNNNNLFNQQISPHGDSDVEKSLYNAF